MPIQGGLAGGGTFSGTMNVSSVTQNPPTITATQSVQIQLMDPHSVINDQTPIANAPNITNQNPSGGNSKSLSVQCNEIGEVLTFSGTGLSPTTQTYICSHAATTVILTFANNIVTSSSNSITVSSVDANGNQTTNNSSFILPIDNQRPIVTVVAGPNIIQGDDATFTITVNDGSSFTPFTPQVSQGTITSGSCSASPCQVTVSGTSVGNLNLIVYSGTVVDAAGNANLSTATNSLSIRASNLSVNSLPMATSLNANNYMVSGNCEPTHGNVTVTIGTPNVSEIISCSGGNYSATIDVTLVTANPMTVIVTQSINEVNPSVAPENDQNGPQVPTATAPMSIISGIFYNLPIVCSEAQERVQISGMGLNPSVQTHTCSNSGIENFNLALAQNTETSNPNNLTLSSTDQHGNSANGTNEVNIPIDTKAPVVSITNPSEAALGNNAVFTITITEGNSFTPFIPYVSSGTITSGQCSSSPCNVIVSGLSLGSLTLRISAGVVVDVVGNSNTLYTESSLDIVASYLSLDELHYATNLNASSYPVAGSCDSNRGSVTITVGTPNVSESVSCSSGSYSATLDVTSVTSNPMAVSVNQDIDADFSNADKNICFAFETSGSEITLTDYLSTDSNGEPCTKSVVIPHGVTVIGDNAFDGNNLIFVEIPESVTSIGSESFKDNDFSFVSISTGGTTIAENAFDSDVAVFYWPSPIIQLGATTAAVNGDNSGSDSCQSVAVDDSGNVYCAGRTSGALGETKGGNGDAFIMKLNSQGTLQWVTQLGATTTGFADGDNSGDDYCYSVALDNLRNVYCAGYTTGDLGEANGGSFDAFVMKLNSSGAVQWVTQLGATTTANGGDNSGGDICKGVTADHLGNIYCAGFTNGDLGEMKGGNGISDDAFVMKLNSQGVIQWVTQLGATTTGFADGDNSEYDSCYGVTVDHLGNIYCAGSTNGALGEANGGNSVNDAFVMKLNSSGAVQWVTQLGATTTGFANGDNSGDDSCQSVAVDDSGNVYCAGSTNGALGEANGSEIAGEYDAFVMKLNSQGVIQWVTQLGATTTGFAAGDNSNHDYCKGVTVDHLGNVYCAGFTDGALGEASGGVYTSDAFVMKLNPSGDLQWVTQLGATTTANGGDNSEDDICKGVTADHLGNIYCAGYTNGAMGEANGGDEDAFVMKLKPNGQLN